MTDSDDSYFDDIEQESPWADFAKIPFPWLSEAPARPAIYQFLMDHAQNKASQNDAPYSDGARGVDVALPDADFFYAQVMEGNDTFRNIPGAADVAALDNQEYIEAVFDRDLPGLTAAIEDCIFKPTKARLLNLYQRLIYIPPIVYINEVLDALEEVHDQFFLESLGYMGYAFATMSPDREAVKFGMALIGNYYDQEQWPLILTLGKHAEFSRYASYAIEVCSRAEKVDPRPALFELAQSTKGWGQFEALSALLRCKVLPDNMRDWIIQEGTKCPIHRDLLCMNMAEKNDLLALIQHTDFDTKSMMGVLQIVHCLINAGNATGEMPAIFDQENAQELCLAILDKLSAMPPSSYYYAYINNMYEFWHAFTSNSEDAMFITKLGFSVEIGKSIVAKAKAYLAQGFWEEVIRKDLINPDPLVVDVAIAAAEVLGKIDCWPVCFERQKNKTDGEWLWWGDLLKTVNPERLDQAIALAEEQLDLQALSSIGPKLNYGDGTEYERFYELETILENLRFNQYKGRGFSLIKTGLVSPIVQVRSLALENLYFWPKHHKTDEVRNAVEQASFKEPDEWLKEAMQKFLRGAAIPEYDEAADQWGLPQ